MSLMTIDLAAEFSTRAIVPTQRDEPRAMPRRSSQRELPSLNLFSLDLILSRRPERVEEDGERWDGLA
jgi:hypothetical protein